MKIACTGTQQPKQFITRFYSQNPFQLRTVGNFQGDQVIARSTPKKPAAPGKIHFPTWHPSLETAVQGGEEEGVYGHP